MAQGVKGTKHRESVPYLSTLRTLQTDCKVFFVSLNWRFKGAQTMTSTDEVNQTVFISTSIEIAGKDADAIARAIASAMSAGMLDLAIVNLLRNELRGVTGDWRIVTVTASYGEVQS